jgi:hypothetical protein
MTSRDHLVVMGPLCQPNGAIMFVKVEGAGCLRCDVMPVRARRHGGVKMAIGRIGRRASEHWGAAHLRAAWWQRGWTAGSEIGA